MDENIFPKEITQIQSYVTRYLCLILKKQVIRYLWDVDFK